MYMNGLIFVFITVILQTPQVGPTLPWTTHKEGLHAPDCPFLSYKKIIVVTVTKDSSLHREIQFA
jgi:hypothetical protein